MGWLVRVASAGNTLGRSSVAKPIPRQANPTLPVTAQISHGLGMTLEQFAGELEDLFGSEK